MATPFLDNLKKAVDTGEFNSEAAKKIIEIDKVADNVTGMRALDFAFDMANKEGAIQSVTEEEAAVLNSEYEKKMEEIKKQDAINAQLATLIEIEDMVKLSVIDMLTFTKELEEKFSKELEVKDPMFNDLYFKIQEVKNVFEPTLLEYKHKE